MTIDRKAWLVFLLCALVSVGVWAALSYPEFSFIDLSVDRATAVAKARQFLREKELIDPLAYRSAAILVCDDAADRYLQKTLGFQAETEFNRTHRFDLYHWTVRFYREGIKEEFRVGISSSTGKVAFFHHAIDDTAARPDVSAKDAQATAEDFLQKTFGIDLAHYVPKEQSTKKFDNRVNHSYSWSKKDVEIPWGPDPDDGTAKLLTRVTISGDDILSFDHNDLEIPDKFSRAIERGRQSGAIIAMIFIVVYYLLIMAATLTVILRRNHLAMHLTKNFYVGVAAVVFAAAVLFQINNLESLFFHYPTTASLKIYISEFFLSLFFTTFLLSVTFLMPALAGEAYARQDPAARKEGGALHFILSSFRTRKVFGLVLLGYFTAACMLGIQSLALFIGRKFFGVWTEHARLPQLSSSYWPFFTAFFIGLRASVNEEATFRLFGINGGKRILKNAFLACALSSVIWGFGHTQYAIFPMWFRGIEVSFLGFLLSFVYLRFGLVPVVVGHYLFNVFWGVAAFVFGHAAPFDLYSSLAVLALPLGFGLIGYFANKPSDERPMAWHLKAHHLYNLRILQGFLRDPKSREGKTKAQLAEELITNGWDTAVVDEALKDLHE